jgi:hypothetical protein
MKAKHQKPIGPSTKPIPKVISFQSAPGAAALPPAG